MTDNTSSFEIDKTRKHYEPRFYLRGFSPDRPNSQDKIWVFDKHDPDAAVRLSSINNVSVSRHAYSKGDDAEITRLERGFKTCLDGIVPHVEEHGDFPIKSHSESEKLLQWMALFLSMSELRSSGRRSPSRPEIRSLYQETLQMHEDFMDGYEKEHPELLDYFQTRDIPYQAYQDMLLNVSGLSGIRKWIAKVLDPIGRHPAHVETRRLLEEGNWRFYRAAPCRTFITSDQPAGQLRLGPEPEFYECISWNMPLSKAVCVAVMCGPWADTSGKYPAPGLYEDDKLLDLQNLCHYKAAYRFVYSSSEYEILRAKEWNESGMSPLRDVLP